MGNGLRKAIKEERWGDVRPMLQTPSVQERIRHKRYRGVASRKTRSSKSIEIRIMRFLCRTCNPDEGEETSHRSKNETVTALHLVATRNAPIDIVQSILQIEPNLITALSEPNEELPLHYAAKYPRSNPKMIQILIEAYPESCIQLSPPRRQEVNNNEDEENRNSDGDGPGAMMTPLHMACRAQRKIKILKALVDHSPDPDVLLQIQDRKGRTPFQVLTKHTSFWHVRYRHAARQILIPKEEEEQVEQQQVEQQTEFWDAVQDENGRMSVIVSSPETKKATTTTRGGGPPVGNNNTNQKDNESESGLCVLCWNGSASRAMIPCGHICICQECSTRPGLLQSLNHKCPLCTKHVQNCIRIYSSGISIQDEGK